MPKTISLSIKLILAYIIIAFSIVPINGQTVFRFNVLTDLEFSKAGDKSHFYYNEIHENHIDYRLGISQANLIGQMEFNHHWSLNARLLLEREKGQKLKSFKIPQLNIQWLSARRKLGVTLGNFINPFGSFNQQQLSTERDFVGLPLAYSYYVNISDKIGFVEGMGDITKIPIDGEVQWGSTHLYYGGYTSGAMLSWNVKPGKINWKIALVTGASTLQSQFTDPLHYGIISKVKFQPKYFWEQGFSFSHGTFLRKSEVSETLSSLKDYSQSLLGTDIKLGHGYFEFSGELIAAFYQVPLFNGEENVFEGEKESLSSVAVYFDTKYEPPIIPGSYFAYRIDYLSFSKETLILNEGWDNNVLRHSFALGYNINQYILARVAVSTQHVDNKKWDKAQRTLRLVLTAHY